MKALLTIVLLLIFSGEVFSQNGTADKVRREKNSYDELIASSKKSASERDYRTAVSNSSRALTIALQLADSAAIVEASRITGQLQNYLGSHSGAIETLQGVKLVARRNGMADEHKKILSNLAIAYTYTARFDNALDAYFDVLAIDEEGRDSVSMGYTLNNIGLVYYRVKNYQEALKFYTAAYEIQSRINPENIEVLINNIGFCYSYLNDHHKALTYFERTLQLCTTCKEETVLEAKLGLGVSNFELGNKEAAFKYLEGCYSSSVELNNRRFMVESMLYIGKFYIATGSLDDARKILLTLEEKVENDEAFVSVRISAYELLSYIYKTENDSEKALEYLESHVALKDKVYRTEMLQNIADAKSDYLERENLAAIKAHQITIDEQKKQTWFWSTIAVLASLLLILFVSFTVRGKRLNRSLIAAQELIHEQNKKLEVRNIELDRMVAKKTEELHFINLSLKEMNRELNSFISKTSEDIKAPLATLKGICNVALMDIKDNTGVSYIKKIRGSVDGLFTILKRLLIINKINQSRIISSEIDLRSLLDSVVVSLQSKGLPHNLTLRKNISGNTTILSDKDLLTVVIENSIESAIRFCDNSPRAEHFVEIKLTSENNGRLVLRVINNGLVRHSYIDGLEEMELDLTSQLGATDGEDLYFLKTAAKKIGGKVDVKTTAEGYNELLVII